MTKAFTKGQAVTHIALWNGKGTFTVRHAIVHSCGMKQMVLTDAVTNEDMGRHFLPIDSSKSEDMHAQTCGTFPRMTDAEALDVARRLSAEYVAEQRVYFSKSIEQHGDRAVYKWSTQKQIDDLAVDAIMYADGIAAIKARIALG